MTDSEAARRSGCHACLLSFSALLCLLCQDNELLSLAASFKVPTLLVQALKEDGWDVASFAMSATSVAEVDGALLELLPDSNFTLQERANSRLLWQRCHAITCGASFALPEPPADPASISARESASSWASPFPPKVSADTLQSLKKEFLKSYTSEVLDPDTLPSPRLLALVKANVDGLPLRSGWRWVAWKFRLSQRAHDEKDSIALSSRPRKMAKLDLSDLLLDDIPLREIPSSGQLGNYQLSQILSLHSVAVALCKGCHLSTLRAYERAFLELATKRYPSELNLRSPAAQELEHADRMLWEQISALLCEDWKLDDALHQVTAVRSSLHVLLCPRPALPKHNLNNKGQQLGRDPPKGLGRGRGGKGKFGRGRGDRGDKGSDSGGRRHKWATTFNGKTLCLRFNSRSGCSDKNCKYLHQCCVVDENNNKVCGGKHPAFEHPGNSFASA